MKSCMILTGALLLAFAPAAGAGDAGVDAVIRQFADALHAGDMKAAKALLAKLPAKPGPSFGNQLANALARSSVLGAVPAMARSQPLSYSDLPRLQAAQ